MSDQCIALIVDDDQGTRETFEIIGRRASAITYSASTGSEALAIAELTSIDTAFVDLRLPDMDGLQVIRALQAYGSVASIVLISAFVTPSAAVEAMKIGAFEVLEKPVSLELFERTFQQASFAGLHRSHSIRETENQFRASMRPAESPTRGLASRWASLIIKAVTSKDDIKTVSICARSAGVSRTTFCETCQMLGVLPHDARDLARFLRALINAQKFGEPIAVWLDVGDVRTLESLMSRAGFKSHVLSPTLRIDEFLRQQAFIDSQNPAIVRLRDLFAQSVNPTGPME